MELSAVPAPGTKRHSRDPPSMEGVAQTKEEGRISQPNASLDASEWMQVEGAKQAIVPVVVLGATIGGLAAAVAIRSRTGRAVCVVDTGTCNEYDSPCVLSTRSLDAVRAINVDLYRAILGSVAEEAAADPKACSLAAPRRLSSLVLRKHLIQHLTAGSGGASSLWRSPRLEHIFCLSSEKQERGGDSNVVLAFEGGSIVKAGLVVAAEDFSFLVPRDPAGGEHSTTNADSLGDGSWFLRGFEGLHGGSPVALSDSEKSTAATGSGSTPLTVDTLREENSSPSGLSLSAGEDSPASFTSIRTFRGSTSLWSFGGGRLILIGAAAHPWASSSGYSLELDLEDAAQLGCSLYDWKFALKPASDRFEAIRKRRLASALGNPRARREYTSESPEGVCSTSTVSASPEFFLEEEPIFVPTRDAYAELLPASSLGYEVQEAQFC